VIGKQMKLRLVRLGRNVRGHVRLRTRVRALFGDADAKRANERARRRLRRDSAADTRDVDASASADNDPNAVS
jgi:hypothetical protein